MNILAIKTIKGQSPMKLEHLHADKDDVTENNLICIFPKIEYQEISGFGGAFTEAAAVTFSKLNESNQNKVLKLYFDPQEGIGYTCGRIHINSCDFSLGNYSCIEENDITLKTFNVNRDKKFVIPMIKAAKKYADISIFASPWSPPAFMKTTNQMNNGGKLKKEFYELWSDYFVKFIEEYKNEGISISSVSVQNEPKATQIWDSCVYTAEEEMDFIKNHLGIKMQDLGIDLYFWDHNKERIIERANCILRDDEASKYVKGIAFHWYSGDHFEQLDIFKKLYPDKDLIFSEGCYEYSLGKSDTTQIGEKYAHDIIGNFNNGCSAFYDWNILLNESGGPNHVGNFCDAPIMADTKNNILHIHDSYYYIGHFSKFIKQGAKRIASSKWSNQIDTISFKNSDGNIATVVLNSTDTEYDFSFRIMGNIISSKIEPHSIATYIFTEI